MLRDGKRYGKGIYIESNITEWMLIFDFNERMILFTRVYLIIWNILHTL